MRDSGLMWTHPYIHFITHYTRVGEWSIRSISTSDAIACASYMVAAFISFPRQPSMLARLCSQFVLADGSLRAHCYCEASETLRVCPSNFEIGGTGTWFREHRPTRFKNLLREDSFREQMQKTRLVKLVS